MHRLRMIGVASVFLACAIGACGDDETGEDTGKGSGGGGGDSGGAKDTGVVTADDSSTLDASTIDGGTCLDLLSTAQGFTLQGGATHEAGKGIVLTMTPGATPAAVQAFTSTAPLTRSTVRIDVKAERDNTAWGGTADDLVEVFSQFYGATTSYIDAPASRLLMTGNAFELMIWNAPNVPEGNHPLSAAALLNASSTITIDETWGTAGKVDVGIDSVMRTVSGNTMAGTTQNKLTIYLGGRARGSVPTYKLTFTKVCVDVQ